MIQIQEIILFFNAGDSDKIYEVKLCQLTQDDYVVNFRYGRRGTRLREGTKTAVPTDLKRAKDIFNSVVISKINKGYRPLESNIGQPPSTPTPLSTDPRDRIDTAILARFRKAIDRKDPKILQRAVWRIGERGLTAAVPELVRLIPSKDELTNYTVTWALGRCGIPSAYHAIARLNSKTKAVHVKYLSLAAMLFLAEPNRRDALVDQLMEGLPPKVRQALEDNNIDQLSYHLRQQVKLGGDETMDTLTSLYLLADFRKELRRLIMDILESIPFTSRFFRAVRRIFKLAEFRQDWQVFAILVRRFEITSPFYITPRRNGIWIGSFRKYIPAWDEVKKPNSRLAYSNLTRNYLRKRAWRTLRRMGLADEDDYAELATEILLTFNESHTDPPKISLKRDRRQVVVKRYNYGAYSGFLVFNHIIRGNSPYCRLSKSGVAWEMTKLSKDDYSEDQLLGAREEKFPHIWNRHPNLLLKLLSRSQCAPIHRFAARALLENTAFCERLTTRQIVILLSKPFLETISLGMSLAQGRFDSHRTEVGLIIALLEARLEAARYLACRWIRSTPSLISDYPQLTVRILTNPLEEIRYWGRTLLMKAALPEDKITSLIARLIAYMMAHEDQKDGATREEVIANIEPLFLGVWKDICRRLNLLVIEDLLNHEQMAVQILGAKMILQHQTPPQMLPPGMIGRLIESKIPEVRRIAVRVFTELPDAYLVNQTDLVAAFCITEEAAGRQEAYQVVRRVAQRNLEFGTAIFNLLLPFIFRKEPIEGVHRDLSAILHELVVFDPQKQDTQMVWRLLNARSKGAQSLGASLLPEIAADQFSVRQWAHLGSHALLSVRQATWRTYQAQPHRILAQPADGLRLLDSHWDDSRAFAMEFIPIHFNASFWTPNLLVSVCDSNRKDVQQFGRKLLTTFFKEQDGAEYLLKLSQHPSSEVQMFASNFLIKYADGRQDRLEKLTSYFKTVLSQVNRGRVAKSRLMTFLRSQALSSFEAARIIIPILEDISATIAIGDRGDCIKLLCEITGKYAGLSSRLQLIPVERRHAAKKEAEYAV